MQRGSVYFTCPGPISANCGKLALSAAQNLKGATCDGDMSSSVNRSRRIAAKAADPPPGEYGKGEMQRNDEEGEEAELKCNQAHPLPPSYQHTHAHYNNNNNHNTNNNTNAQPWGLRNQVG